jgi:hypothetical protein
LELQSGLALDQLKNFMLREEKFLHWQTEWLQLRMSAASFISMAGIISFDGYDGAVYLMGWTGGYVLLALLVAPISEIWEIYCQILLENDTLTLQERFALSVH